MPIGQLRVGLVRAGLQGQRRALDLRLPFRWTAGLFLLGLVGTWLQNVVRVTFLFLAGSYWGEEFLGEGHKYSSLAVFPRWFLPFACVYLKVAAPFRGPVVSPATLSPQGRKGGPGEGSTLR